MATRPKEPLLERERELARVRELVERAEAGEGALLAIAGPAGIGKTRLLASVRELAGDREWTILTARGAEHEGELPFGIARQLLEPPTATAPAERRAQILAGAAALAAPVLGERVEHQPAFAAADPTFSAIHGLYWATVNLIGPHPAVLAIDDAQWADLESIRWLDYLMRRLEGLPVLVVLGVRLGEPGTRAGMIDALAADPTASTIEPRPLTEAAVGELARELVGSVVDAEFASGCHRATGGNPFLVTELLRALADDEIDPIAENADRVLATGPAAVRRSVLARLARLPPACRSLARALAVAGDGTELELLAELAGIDSAAAQAAGDALVEAAIAAPESPPALRHPILRASIYEDIAPFARAEAHARAAALLASRGADAERVASHLLWSEPAGSGWVVERLREAAHAALEKGSPQTATDLLRRALAEPPGDDDLGDVLTDLGLAEMLAHNESAAISHLRAAIDLTADPLARALVARPLATALLVEGRAAEGVATLAEAIAGLPDGARELRLRMEADICSLGYFGYEAHRIASARWIDGLEPAVGEPGGRPLVGALASEVVQRGGHAVAGGELALAACGDGMLLAEEGPDLPPFYLVANALIAADEIDAAVTELSSGMQLAAARGSRRGLSLMVAYRAVAHLRRGAVPQAEADARAYLDLGAEAILFGLPPALSTLVWALIERGELVEAEAEVTAHPEAGRTREQYDHAYVAFQRARLRVVQGRDREALDDLRFCGRHERAYGIETPAMIAWRSEAALCLNRLGEAEEASSLVAAELDRARAYGAPRPLGIALRAAALLEQGQRRLELLDQAASVLAGSPDRVEHARVLTDLGSALRHERRKADARHPLREGLAIARRCGATAIAERSHAELLASGARPRKMVRGGFEALTPSELRVAELAAEGRSNRQIAQILFVTVKTVETHLNRVYRKLEIDSRSELSAALHET